MCSVKCRTGDDRIASTIFSRLAVSRLRNGKGHDRYGIDAFHVFFIRALFQRHGWAKFLEQTSLRLL